MTSTRWLTILVILVIAFGSTVLLAPHALAQTAGQGVGVNRLGQSRAVTLHDMGKPEEHYTLPGGVTADRWGSTRMFYRRNILIQISVQSLVDPLPGNITMGSTVAQLQARHPGLKRHEYTVHGSGGGAVDYYDDRTHGIAFEFTQAMAPGPGDPAHPKLYAVIIHKRGTGVIPDSGETLSRS